MGVYIISAENSSSKLEVSERGDDTVGNPHRAQIVQFELFELILLLKLYKGFSIEQFEPTVSQPQQHPPLSRSTARSRARQPRASGTSSRPRPRTPKRYSNSMI